jgi:hypothetical protein
MGPDYPPTRLLRELNWPELVKLGHCQEDIGNSGCLGPLEVRDGKSLCRRIDLQFLEEGCKVLKAAEAVRLGSLQLSVFSYQ